MKIKFQIFIKMIFAIIFISFGIYCLFHITGQGLFISFVRPILIICVGLLSLCDTFFQPVICFSDDDRFLIFKYPFRELKISFSEIKRIKILRIPSGMIFCTADKNIYYIDFWSRGFKEYKSDMCEDIKKTAPHIVIDE